MHYKFTLKHAGRIFRMVPIVAVLLCLFAGSTTAQCTWTAATAHPSLVLDRPVATVGTNMYAFAGVVGGAISSASQKFDGTAWTAIAPTPTAIEFPSAVSNGTNIYIMGGALTGTGAPQTTNYRYNVATDTYTTLAPSSVGTWSHAAVFLNGKIYKIGGIAAAPSSAVEIYDIAANTWTAGAAYPIAAGFVSAVELGGFIYAAGGIDAAGTAKTFRYDPVANTWNDAAIADLPATRWGAAHAAYRNGFVLAGGYVGGDVAANMSTSVISWDPNTNTWTALPSMLAERSRMTGAILNDAFHVIGGRSIASPAFGGTNNNQKLSCPPLVACTGTPAPGNTFASSTVVCPGTLVSLSAQNPTSGTGVTYQWQTSTSSTGPWANVAGVGTNPSYTATAAATAFYRVSVTCGANTASSTPVQVTVTPCTCITPDLASICEGTIQKLTVTGAGIPGTTTATSGAITVAIPDANAAGASTTLPVTLPAGASITSVSVNFNITHTWDADLSLELVSPNGKIINLVSRVGGSGDNFVNTNVAVVPLPSALPVINTGTAPFTGTYRYQGVAASGATAYTSNVTTFAAFNTPGVASGAQNWRLSMRDYAGGDVGTLTSWAITVNYEVLPTAIWTGGTIFSDASATTPYVAGTQANAVWVMPSATTTYTANIASGPCAGNNTVTVTVLPRPVVTVNPATGCGPLTLTASGAASYSWTPSAGLNATTGATVTANPNSTTTYTVTGTGANGCVAVPVSAVVNSAPTASIISPVAGSTFQLQESFTGTVPPAGWAQQNLSSPIGVQPWFRPTSPAPFPAFSGTETQYAAVNYQSGAGTSTLSNWLFSPVLNIKNGDFITFYTRTTDGTFPDRLQLRLSTSGASVNVGATATSTGDFGTLLVDVNPNLTTSGYPTSWTQFTGTVTGVTGTVTGRFAFRYFVTGGGTTGANSDFIGVDDVAYGTPSSVNCANVVTNIKVDITGGVGPYTVVYSNGTTNTTINGYVSGSNIQVSPAVSTNYTIVSVTGANGCLGTGNSGTAAIVITPAPSITTQPASTGVCVGNNATFTVASAPLLGNNFQWQVSTDNGTTYTNLTNTGIYSGVNTATLTVTGVSTPLTGNRYRVIVTGACPGTVTSTGATLTVNTAAVITTQPVNTVICAAGGGTPGTSATFSVAATGGQLTYQWQVSVDGIAPYTNVTDGTNYSGATTSTLTVTNATAAFANYRYRVNVTSGGCTAVTSNVVSVAVRPFPVLVLSANPITNIYPGLTTTLSVAVSPNAGATYTWFKNGVIVPGATGNTLVVDVDGAGTYTVSVNDVNGCNNISNAITINEVAQDILFIYPSPSTGQFQVRYFSDLGTTVYPRTVNVFDSKGSRVYTRSYSISSPYTRIDVNLDNQPKGIYTVELTDYNGMRIKTGRVVIL